MYSVSVSLHSESVSADSTKFGDVNLFPAKVYVADSLRDGIIKESFGMLWPELVITPSHDRIVGTSFGAAPEAPQKKSRTAIAENCVFKLDSPPACSRHAMALLQYL